MKKESEARLKWRELYPDDPILSGDNVYYNSNDELVKTDKKTRLADNTQRPRSKYQKRPTKLIKLIRKLNKAERRALFFLLANLLIPKEAK